ncbi:MAG: HDOD domain-containing protein, partial [Actinomycetota bacterium]|nr:HDOD domain-containing protein [Actinomycetota bacterium]
LLTSVLRLVNSSRYTARGSVSTASQAVVLLGFNVIRNLVCAVGVADYFQKNGASSFDYEQFLRHSAGVGSIAKSLATHVGMSPDTTFVAGMLHDLGQLALAATLPDEYRMVMDHQMLHGCHISEAEQAVIGMDHSHIGAHLARLWHLPEEICEAIERHHQTPEDYAPSSPMADLVHVSEVLAHALELGTSGQVPLLSEGAMHRIGLSMLQIKQSFGRIEEEYGDILQMMGPSGTHQQA